MNRARDFSLQSAARHAACGLGAALLGLAVILPAVATQSIGAPASKRWVWERQYRRPSAIPFPKDDLYTRAKYELGRTLFFDPILSGSKVRACASCHNPGLSWADGQPLAVGEDQKPLTLRTPTLLNVAWTPRLGWDGHFSNLESVAIGPITADGNMNLPADEMVGRLAAIPGYVTAFDKAFGKGDITTDKVEMALATFERTIVSPPAPFDRWIAGDARAIGEPAKRGFDLFNGKANCAACHSGWAFTDASFHDIGVARHGDLGRGALFPSSVALQHAFKTPTLRDVARRAPYMHNGSLPSLRDVIDLYDRGGVDRPSRDEAIRPLGLTDDEKDDLVAFLDTLSSPAKPVTIPELPR